MNGRTIEDVFFQVPRGIASRVRLFVYRMFGMRMGVGNRMEGRGRVRRCGQIRIGDYNAFTEGCWLWPENTAHVSERIRIGSGNYFNRGAMIDACGLVEIGNDNMFGPDVYITDSNHRFGDGIAPKDASMRKGRVKIGDRCWIGAKAVVLMNVELGDGCVVGAGAVVTKSFPAGSVVVGVPARAIQTTAAAWS